MPYQIFIDGQEGTTGLKIAERFAGREDLSIIPIEEERRKDPMARKERINASDITFLCLPDAAAKEAVSLVENPKTRIIDASTAHRTAPGWVYGFPELSMEQREAVCHASRVAVPGCHASGMISLVYPLIAHELIDRDYPITCHSVTGYSGGGKKMIAQYEDPNRDPSFDSPRQYGLNLYHKHLPEMQTITGLSNAPLFNPIVSDYFSGMIVTVPLFTRLMKKKMRPAEVLEVFADHYQNQIFIKVLPMQDVFLPANTLAGTNQMEILIGGNAEQILLCSRFDNLGKGASGAAVQCMNLMLGLEEQAGLA